MSNHFPSTSCHSVKQTLKCWIQESILLSTAYWKLCCYVAKVSKLISIGNKCLCGRFQNNISFNIENIKQKQNLKLNNGRFTGHFMEIYVWVWCSLNLFACSRIPVLKEPVLLLLSRMTRTITPFVRKVSSQTLPKCFWPWVSRKFSSNINISNFDLPSWICAEICLWFALVSTWHFCQKICSVCAFLLKI